MDTQTIEKLAEQLLTAEATCTPIEVPTVTYPDMLAEDGYRVQRAIIAHKMARGEKVVGKKSG